MAQPFFNIPYIDSGIPAGTEIVEEYPYFEAPPSYAFNADNLNLIHANYPRNILFDLEDAIGDVIISSPPGTVVDFVELSEKACRLYDDYSQFYSLSDDLFDGHDRDSFMTALRGMGAFDGLSFTAKLTSNDIIETMYNMHVAALERYVDTVMRKLASHRVPALSNIGCIYMPDGFIADTTCLVLKLKLDH